MNSKVTELKKALKKKVNDLFEVGDVIRWVAADRYNYAAIKTPVGWYTTANNNSFVPNVMSFDKLLEVLERSEATDIQVASEWEDVR